MDVTQPLGPETVVWPGDPPVVLERFSDQLRGEVWTASRLATSVHAGTHVDAPRHYFAGGAGVETMPPSVCVGRARVLHMIAPPPWPAAVFLAQRIGRGQRLLLRTRSGGTASPPPSVGALSLEAARFLAARRIALVGIDAPSIGPQGEVGDEVHRVLLSAGIWIVEGLDLAGVPAGGCDLVCAPLRLPGADGAPARVLVRPRSPRRR
jgi:arylformamidase